MGNVYKELGRFDEAIKCYETSIRICPTFCDAYSNLAATFKDTGRPMEAIEHYAKALELRPNMGDAFANYVHTKNFVCDWTDREELFSRLSQQIQEQLGDYDSASASSHSGSNSLTIPSVQPFHAIVYPLSMAEMQQIARRYAQKVKLNVSLTADGCHYSHRPKPHSVRMKSKWGHVWGSSTVVAYISYIYYMCD